MKSKLLILGLLLGFLSFGQSVPNTTTFSLQDVVDVVNPTTDDLVDCFSDAVSSYFDATYSGTKTNLLNFRNYGPKGAVPTVTTNTPHENETQDSYVILRAVAIGGVVTNNGGSSITGVGIVFSSSDATPTIGESGVTNQILSGSTSFSIATRTGFTPGSTYYIRAYATNVNGTGYASNIEQYTICTPNLSVYTSSVVAAYGIEINGSYTDFYTSSFAASQACYDYNNPGGRTIVLSDISLHSTSTTSTPVVNDIPYLYQVGWCHRLADGYYYSQKTGQDYLFTVSGGVIASVTACP